VYNIYRLCKNLRRGEKSGERESLWWSRSKRGKVGIIE